MSKKQQPILVEDVKVSGTDMILPATLLFLILYFPVCSMMLARGMSQLSIFMLLTALWLVLCGALFAVKHFMAMNNMPMTSMVTLLDSNVGCAEFNWMIIVLSLSCASGCIYAGQLILLPAFLATGIAFSYNIYVGKRYWELEEPGSGWIPYHHPNFSPEAPVNPSGKRLVVRNFSWTEILQSKNITPRDSDDFKVTFAEPDYTDEHSADYVRKSNPFYSEQPYTDDDYTRMAAVVKSGSSDPYERAAISQIIQSAEELCRKYALPDYEMYDLLLKFCQFNIKYRVDDECDSINHINEYFRFPGETLFDLEGDCDCKAVLAYSLFHMLGAKVELVSVCIKNDNNPEGRHNHAAIILKDDANKIKLPASFQKDNYGQAGKGVYCEATAEGFQPGWNTPDLVKDNVIVI